MAAPNWSHEYTYSSSSNEAAASLAVNGSSEFATGDFLVVFSTVDGEAASIVIATGGVEGFTTLYSTETAVGSNGVSGACHYKELVSGDTSETTVEVDWTGNQKAAIVGYRIPDAEHNGFDDGGVFVNAADTSGELPAVTYGTDTLSLGVSHMDANVDVSVEPTGYTEIEDINASGSGNVSMWIGEDDLTGSQSANTLTLSSGRGNLQGIIGIAAVAGGALTRIVDEVVNLQSGTIASRGITRLIAATVNINETSLRNLGILRLVSEVTNIVEATSRHLGITRLIAETTNIVESVLKQLGIVRLVDETSNLVEGVLHYLGLVRTSSETVNISEAALQFKGLLRLIAETVNLNETFLKFRALVRLPLETVNINASTQRNLVLLRLVGETINVVETVASLLAIVRSSAEVVNLNETSLNFLGLLRLSPETVNVSESTLDLRGIIRLVAETVNVVETTLKLVSAATVAGVTWATLTVLPKIQMVIDFIGPKISGKIDINDAGESDL